MTEKKIEILESFTLFSGIEVESSVDIPDDYLALLSETIFGTEGALRYRHRDIDKLIYKLEGRRVMSLRRRGKILGTVLILHRLLRNAGDPFPGLYVRYLSMMQHRPGGKPETRKQKRSKGADAPKSLVREMLKEISDHELARAQEEVGKGAVLYAYVEQNNVYSRNLCLSLGYVPVRKLLTAIFSRLLPKRIEGVREIRTDEKDWMADRIRDFYKGYSFVPDDLGLEFGNCYVLEKDGARVAGLQAIPQDWDIVELPGFGGWFMLNVFSKIPLLGRMFDGKTLNFNAFSSVWYEPGHEYAITMLMEHASAVSKRQMGMYWADTGCEVMKSVLASGKLGFVNNVVSSNEADILVRALHADPAAGDPFFDKPAFVNALDVV